MSEFMGANPPNPLEQPRSEYPYRSNTMLDTWNNSETNNQPLREVEVSGHIIETDLPDGVDIVLVGTVPKRPSIPIVEVDKLPAGKFTLYDQDNKSFTQGNVAITEHDQVRRVAHNETSIPVYGLRPIGKGAKHLMEELGFIVDRSGNWADESPTPSSLKSKASSLDVDITFFPNDNLIPAPEYLNVFKDGKYPVALGSSEYYAHDTSDDHITAMVLGGAELKDALAAAASRAMDIGEAHSLDDAAAGVDKYTAALRRVINPNGIDSDGPRPEFMSASGRRVLHRIGLGLGITPELSDSILAAAQNRAREHGIPVQELA